jgi:hypothetical protein
MPLVILHHLLNAFVELANKRGLKNKIFAALINVKTGNCIQVWKVCS